MTSPGDTIPRAGTFLVGVDIKPGRYRCEDGRGGWWVRFTGPDGGEPVGSWPLPAGPTEVEIEPTDFAFETRTRTNWRMVGPAGEPGRRRPEPRPVADPTLRAELDRIVARHRLPARLVPALAALACAAGVPALGPAWLMFAAPVGLTAVFGARLSDDLRRARALDRRRDRYLLPEDFDEEAKALLVRAQGAVRAVLDSAVCREGLLDAADNARTLPQQEWEIAQALARQSVLRRREREIADSADLAVPELAAVLEDVLEDRRGRLAASVRAVTRRIEALERYADRVRAADRLLGVHRRLRELASSAHEYDDLLAATVRDELALPVIERLTAEGESLLHRLRADLAEAAGAAGGLSDALPGDLTGGPPAPGGATADGPDGHPRR
ncbi:hypothetical protein [Thermomonospora catenispora]|uniref:hypothetical protein n=1 Tax=Thermomonospora catenispora TaxID=2493090 RepID=UPI00158F4973|nr:hypothetical protein [Thermomonospora catenispora]